MKDQSSTITAAYSHSFVIIWLDYLWPLQLSSDKIDPQITLGKLVASFFYMYIYYKKLYENSP